MGKRIEDLRKLDDTLIARQVEALDDTPARPPWYQFLATIDDLLDQDAYLWASESLTGIRDTVERTQRVSEAQARAVEHIAQATRESRRRYEGWRGRGR